MLDEQPIATLISDGCLVDGNLKATAFARIDGIVNGDVDITDGLILGEKGNVKGNVITKEMVVYGEIKGNISTESLDIRNTGKVYGDIKTKILKVDAGAFYTGHLIMVQTEK